MTRLELFNYRQTTMKKNLEKALELVDSKVPDPEKDGMYFERAFQDVYKILNFVIDDDKSLNAMFYEVEDSARRMEDLIGQINNAHRNMKKW